MANNHYPIFGRRIPPSCPATPQDTANPFTPPTCPGCVARLEWKVAAEQAAAEERGITKGERQLHLKAASMFADILSGCHQVPA